MDCLLLLTSVTKVHTSSLGVHTSKSQPRTGHASIFALSNSCDSYLIIFLLMFVQELESRLNDSSISCGSVLIFNIRRDACRLPYRCCVTARLAFELNEHGSPLSRAEPASRREPSSRETHSTESEDPPTLMEALVAGQKRQRHAENAAREAEEDAASVRAEAAAAQSQLRKVTAYASSLTAARAVADEKARKLREVADRLAPPKSD